jgi:hypothetical protein
MVNLPLGTPAIRAKADNVCSVRAFPLLTDTVAKGFCASERAILIQDQAPARNLDSKTQPL